MRESLRGVAPWAVAGALTALVIALLDPVRPFGGWGYLALLVPGGAVLWAAWRWVAGRDGPRWLPYAVGVAALLRLGVGVFLFRALPVAGYPDSEPHQAGYYYQDAWLRDDDAWELSQKTSQPLNSAFSRAGGSDQYGGLLFVSASIYRSLSFNAHRPLLIISLGAVASGLAALFTWGFAADALGTAVASLAAWGIALYPEAVLLGASQMREPFLIAGLAASLYGLALYRNGRHRAGISILVAALSLCAPISPPYVLIFALAIGGALLWERRSTGLRLAVIVGAIAVLGLSLTAGAWGRIEQAPQGSLAGLLDWWVNSGAQFELVRLERGSGFVQMLFDSTPEWAHLPMATGYGLVQPFLPATLLDSTSLPLPRVLGILRGVGWFGLLPFLLYAPFAAVRSEGWRGLVTYLGLLVWVTAVLASFRLAGDLWDNPRSRAVFVSVQISLAAWGWVRAKQSNDRWLSRIVLLVGGSTAIFLQWYAGRYYHTPQLSLNQTMVALALFVVGVIGGAIAWDRARNTRLTAVPPKV